MVLSRFRKKIRNYHIFTAINTVFPTMLNLNNQVMLELDYDVRVVQL